jgi:putative transposase
VLSLYAKVLTTGEISAHLAEIYGASVSNETISRITDKVLEEMNDWAVRPLDEVYAAWYLSASPELMALAGQRLEAHLAERSAVRR